MSASPLHRPKSRSPAAVKPDLRVVKSGDVADDRPPPVPWAFDAARVVRASSDSHFSTVTDIKTRTGRSVLLGEYSLDDDTAVTAAAPAPSTPAKKRVSSKRSAKRAKEK